ncbi:MAG: beta-glucanase (GH16 family), partial [Shewanella psychromarinicola]
MNKLNKHHSFVSCLTALTLSVIFLSGCNADDVTEQATDTVIPNTAVSGWQLVWQDEFEGNQIDTAKWRFAVDCYGGGNDEAQCYTARPENTAVSDGLLAITALRETFSGPAVNDSDPSYDVNDTSKTLDYTSARLVSK